MGIPRAENSKNKGTELCKPRIRGCVPFESVPESSVGKDAQICPSPSYGLVCGVDVRWAGGEATLKNKAPPCCRHTHSC